MEEKVKYSLLKTELTVENQSKWNRHERRVWFITLITGTCMLYSTRATTPLLLPSVAQETKWSKTDFGTILGSFFWGYTLTQVIGGYLSDRFGGQRLILATSIGWSLITLLMPNFIWWALPLKGYTMPFIVTVRILNGALQGVHFPSMISLTSQNLSSTERGSFFGLLMSGAAIGTILTGSFGSFLLDYCGWSYVFRVIGGMGLAWSLVLRYYAMSCDRNRIINVSRLCVNKVTSDHVPWLRYFGRLSFWACVLTHACEMNCNFILLSWLPTYFHDLYPHAKGWVVNMVPWLALLPSTFLAKYLTGILLAKEYQTTTVRKIIQSCCFLTQIIALFILSQVHDFSTSLTCMTIIIAGVGFHNCAVAVNPQDLAPLHSGSVFGLMNTIGAVPGFLSVYLTGYILEVTQSWSVVLNSAAAVNFVGLLLFVVFGSAESIV